MGTRLAAPDRRAARGPGLIGARPLRRAGSRNLSRPRRLSMSVSTAETAL